MHWAHQYVGRKWVSGGRGPLEFDCWGLLWWIYRHHYGRELAEYPGLDARDLCLTTWMARQEVQEWERVELPLDGCAVAMSRNKLIHHVGIYVEVDGGLILHAHDKGNVIAQKVSAVRNSGYRRIEYYQYHGAHHRIN